VLDALAMDGLDDDDDFLLSMSVSDVGSLEKAEGKLVEMMMVGDDDDDDGDGNHKGDDDGRMSSMHGAAMTVGVIDNGDDDIGVVNSIIEADETVDVLMSSTNDDQSIIISMKSDNQSIVPMTTVVVDVDERSGDSSMKLKHARTEGSDGGRQVVDIIADTVIGITTIQANGISTQSSAIYVDHKSSAIDVDHKSSAVDVDHKSAAISKTEKSFLQNPWKHRKGSAYMLEAYVRADDDNHHDDVDVVREEEQIRGTEHVDVKGDRKQEVSSAAIASAANHDVSRAIELSKLMVDYHPPRVDRDVDGDYVTSRPVEKRSPTVSLMMPSSSSSHQQQQQQQQLSGQQQQQQQQLLKIDNPDGTSSTNQSKSKMITASEILMMSKNIVAASSKGHTETMDTIDRINAFKTATTNDHDKSPNKKDRTKSPNNKDRTRYPKSLMKSPKSHHQQQQQHEDLSTMKSVDVGSLVGDLRIASDYSTMVSMPIIDDDNIAICMPMHACIHIAV